MYEKEEFFFSTKKEKRVMKQRKRHLIRFEESKAG